MSSYPSDQNTDNSLEKYLRIFLLILEIIKFVIDSIDFANLKPVGLCSYRYSQKVFMEEATGVGASTKSINK